MAVYCYMPYFVFISFFINYLRSIHIDRHGAFDSGLPSLKFHKEDYVRVSG